MIKKFNNTIEYKNNRYYVELPWKIPTPKILDNYFVAKAQLKRLYKKLKFSDSLESYNQIFKSYIENDFIEEVNSDTTSLSNTHYLTHRGVYKGDSLTTKLRIVYDCSLQDSNKISLNDCLVQGPNLVNDLVKVLINFRLGKFAIISDISKAFLKINLKHDYDKNHLRFLWYKNYKDTTQGLVTYRFKVVPFGATSSPSLLSLTLKYHLNSFPNSPNLEFLKNSFYVDNLVGAVDSELELNEIYKNSNIIMQKGNFQLAEWFSNSNSLNSKIINEQLGYSGDVNAIKVLGLWWNLEESSNNYDKLSIRPPEININANTKRKVLSEVSKLFDPLGLILPIIIRSRIFIQNLWKTQLNWDDIIPNETLKVWQSLAKDLNKVNLININRYAGSKNNNNSLHIFTDSSNQAYGCVAYLVSEDSHLIFAKGKVNPIKNKRSIPQLELLAICLGVKILSSLIKNLSCSLSHIYLWSDSQVCLNWLNQNNNFKTKNVFVKNRLLEISKADLKINFRYIPTNQNPADFISRGLSYRLLKNNKSWYNGPLLLKDPNKWEETPLVCNLGRIIKIPPTEQPLLDLTSFSNYNKLIRITNYCLKFISKCRKLNYDSNSAVYYWVKFCQMYNFSSEYNYLKENPKWKSEKGLPIISDLNLFMDDQGILRCKGRIDKAKLTYASKNPILLPRDSHFTILLIRQMHSKIYHMGVSQTLNEIRKMYWIPKGRAVVKSVLKDCVICKRIHSHSFKTPNPPNLPVERVTYQYPFYSTGIDYTSNLTVTINKISIKVYIVLFTCSATRAISLDIVEDMTAGSFLAAFRRFCARNNTPKIIWSDNALYFKKGEKLINKILSMTPVLSHLDENQIKWKFIPVRSPWYGSIWERNIKTVKDCLKKAVGFRQLNFFELITLLAELENIVNNRPLTYVDSDLNSPEPLTPNHLIKGNIINGLPENIDPTDVDFLIDRDNLIERIQERILIKKKFIDRWKNEYLLSLRQYHKENVGHWENLIRIGDVVLIHSSTPRLSWSLGRVIELLPGEDGISRVARLKTATGETTRDITLLYPLETSLHPPDLKSPLSSPEKGLEPEVSATLSPVSTSTTVGRPKRAAARKADQFIKGKIKEGLLT